MGSSPTKRATPHPVVDADSNRRLAPNVPSRPPEDGAPGGRLAQLVRASALHAEGRGFEPLVAHQKNEAHANGAKAPIRSSPPPDSSHARSPCFQPPNKMHHRSEAGISTSMMASASTQALKRSECPGDQTGNGEDARAPALASIEHLTGRPVLPESFDRSLPRHV